VKDERKEEDMLLIGELKANLEQKVVISKWMTYVEPLGIKHSTHT